MQEADTRAALVRRFADADIATKKGDDWLLCECSSISELKYGMLVDVYSNALKLLVSSMHTNCYPGFEILGVEAVEVAIAGRGRGLLNR